MNHQIALIAYNRPQYLEKTLAALFHAEGIEKYHLLIQIDGNPSDDRLHSDHHVETNHRVIQLAQEVSKNLKPFRSVSVQIQNQNVGCWANKKQGIASAFEQSDYVIIIEDDIVLSKDGLKWFEYIREVGFLDHPLIFAGSAFSNAFSVGKDNTTSLQALRKNQFEFALSFRKWVTPWGWSLKKDKWEQIKDRWNGHDAWLGNYIRSQDWFEIHPVLSRCNNIGLHGWNRRGTFAGPDPHLREYTSSTLNVESGRFLIPFADPLKMNKMNAAHWARDQIEALMVQVNERMGEPTSDIFLKVHLNDLPTSN